MTDFGDDLRALLAKKKETFFVREMQEERQRQAANKLRDDTRRAAERLAREVFLPLLEEFREVMEAAGVLCGGSVVERQGAESTEQGVQGREQGAGSTEYAATPRSLPPASSAPLSAPRSALRLRAAGTAPGSPHFEIRISCTAGDDGGIEAAVECVDVTAAEFGQGAGSREQGACSDAGLPAPRSPLPASSSPLPAPGSPLVSFPPKTFKAAALHDDAVRQWCGEALKKCAAVCLDANRKGRA